MSFKRRCVDVFLIAIISVYLIIQVSAVFIYGDDYYLGDIVEMDDNDDVKYVRSALLLLEEGKLLYQDGDIKADVPTVFIMPGYPFLLAFFLKLFGLKGGLLAIRLVQCLLQAGVMLLLYRIGKKYFNLWTARLALVLYLLYIPNLTVPLLILTESLFAFLFVLLMYLSFMAIETKRMKYYVAGGIVLGLAVLIRPTILLFPVVILPLWLLHKYTLKEIVKRSLVVGCILIALLAPWWIRNAIDFGRFIPLTVASGDPFMQGAFIGYDNREMGQYMVDFPPETDAFATDEAKMDIGKKRLEESLQAKPLMTIGWYSVGKLFCLWGAPFQEGPNRYYESPIQQSLFNVPFEVNVAYHWVLLLLAVFGLRLLCRKGESQRRLKLLLPFSLIYMCVVYLPYFAQPRYVYPLMPLMVLLAAYGGHTAWNRLKKDRVDMS